MKRWPSDQSIILVGLNLSGWRLPPLERVEIAGKKIGGFGRKVGCKRAVNHRNPVGFGVPNQPAFLTSPDLVAHLPRNTGKQSGFPRSVRGRFDPDIDQVLRRFPFAGHSCNASVAESLVQRVDSCKRIALRHVNSSCRVRCEKLRAEAKNQMSSFVEWGHGGSSQDRTAKARFEKTELIGHGSPIPQMKIRNSRRSHASKIGSRK